LKINRSHIGERNTSNSRKGPEKELMMIDQGLPIIEDKGRVDICGR